MTSQEESRLTMYITLQEYLEHYTAITSKLPDFSANSAIWMSTIQQIQLFSQQQKTSYRGYAADKGQQKKSLATMVADYFRKLGSFSKLTKDITLAEKVKITESKILNATDTSASDYAQLAYDLAQELLPSLVKYEITEATQTALKAAITSYNASIGKPGTGRVEGGNTTTQIKLLFKTADGALANMDAAVDVVRLTQPAFYNGYHKAHKVIAMGRGSLAVKAKVTDENGTPLKGVKVLFTLNGASGKAMAANGEPVLMKTTAKKGGCNVKSLPEGIYTVTLKKVGFADQIITISVVDGELTNVKVQMMKA